jgi:hypothetical protein
LDGLAVRFGGSKGARWLLLARSTAFLEQISNFKAAIRKAAANQVIAHDWPSAQTRKLSPGGVWRASGAFSRPDTSALIPNALSLSGFSLWACPDLQNVL